MNDISPVVIFSYNRYSCLKALISDLIKNRYYFHKSKIYIFQDNAKNKNDIIKINKIKIYLKFLKKYKNIKIIERKNNFGLAKNITLGIDYVLKKNETVIVLEDDLRLSNFFLKFMNDALKFYKNNNKIWHISGYNFNFNPSINEDTYTTRLMLCWGWATWKKNWRYLKRKRSYFIKHFTTNEINQFNFENTYNFFNQIIKHKKTWAIFWYAIIFKNRGLCINPKLSLVRKNINFEGTNVLKLDNFFLPKINNNRKKINFVDTNIENKKVYFQLKKNFLKIKIKIIFKNFFNLILN